ncbi:MAG TPA: hypothetical protein VH325_15155 [Bryobacteraceae bacterium]|jgi:hypothetical protein|nr:hypothetical protein [Bryobacteraceae bacterium]
MRNRLALVCGLTLIAIFVATLIVSVLRRAQGASGYPSYSSLNNGDEGLKAYYDALTRLGFLTSRNFLPLHRVTGEQADIVYAGPTLQSLEFAPNADLELFEQIAAKGARVVILLSSEGFVRKTAKKSNEKPPTPPQPTLKNRWGVQVAYRVLAYRQDLRADSPDVFPATWHFSSWTNLWMPSHMRDYSPLFLERRFGKGSVLLVANSRLFTNRELLLKPDAQVLAALPGAHRRIIFDESHLGIEDTGTVAGLATAHHLQWLLLGLVGLAAIYAWRSSFSFVPPAGRPADASIAGQDAGLSLARLLAQSIPPRALLLAVAEEWNRSRTQRHRSAHDIDEAQLARLRLASADQAAHVYNQLAHHHARPTEPSASARRLGAGFDLAHTPLTSHHQPTKQIKLDI